MPTRIEIQQEISTLKNQAQDDVRRKYLKAAAKHSTRDTILYASAWTSLQKKQVPPSLLMVSTDDIQSFMAAMKGLKGDTLDLVIHSSGGSLEAADQIVQYLRAKYNHIRAIIPHNAMSAATMLACACDEIVMGKQSAIGPIDPQFSWNTPKSSGSCAAQALMDELETAKADINLNPNLAAIWAPRLKDYPAGIFEQAKQAMQLAEHKVQGWLENYMFKGEDDAVEKSTKIAEWLANAKEHKTHGRPIGYDFCLEMGLKVTLLENDQKFQENILSLFHAASITFDVSTCIKIVESHLEKGSYLRISMD